MTKREQRKRTQAGIARVREFTQMIKFWGRLVDSKQNNSLKTKIYVFNSYFLFESQLPYWSFSPNKCSCDVTETTLLIVDYLRNNTQLWRNKEFVEMFTKEHNRIITCTYQ